MIKKICFIIHDLASVGGTTRVAVEICNGLGKVHEVSIISREVNQKNAFELQPYVKDIKIKGGGFAFVYAVKNMLQNIKPDLLVIHTMSRLTPLMLMVGIKANQIWSVEHISFEFHSSIYKLMRRLLYKRLDKVITLTCHDAQNYIGNIHHNIEIIKNPCSLPIKELSGASQSKIIISVGRLTYQKGYDILIDAWNKVEKKHPDWQLFIYGEGEEKKNLAKKIEYLGLSRVYLKGLSCNIIGIYDIAAFYVMSSRNEGLPVVLIEAQSRGLPIVSFDCPSGPDEIVSSGKDGYLVKNGDALALAEKINNLIEDKEIRTQFSQQALISAQRFHKDIVLEKWFDLIQKVV